MFTLSTLLVQCIIQFAYYFFTHNPVKVYGTLKISWWIAAAELLFSCKNRITAHTFFRGLEVIFIEAVFFAKTQKINKHTRGPCYCHGSTPTNTLHKLWRYPHPSLIASNRGLLSKQLSYKGYTDSSFLKLGIALVAHFWPTKILTRFWL